MDSVAASGGHRYENGSVYVGCWNTEGERQGKGHLILLDGTRYDGYFENGLFHGYGILNFPDGAKYEGEFYKGWFHGNGVFWRSDSMRYEGEFRGGKIFGLGLITYADGSNGFPRSEGFFQDSQLKVNRKCPESIQKAQAIALIARSRFVLNN